MPRSNPSGFRRTSLRDDFPNCAEFPIDVLSHSTTHDSHSNNAPVRHSNLAAVHPLRGCDRPCRGSLCPVLLPPFRWHAGTSFWHRRARGVLPQIARAPPPRRLPLLFFQIVDSRVSPFCFRDDRNLERRRFYEKRGPPLDIVHPVVATGERAKHNAPTRPRNQAPSASH